VVSLETTFLVDLLNGEAAAVRRAEELQAQGETLCVASPAVAEVLIGAYYVGGPELARAQELLESLIFLELDREACEEAGRIGADLIVRGEALGSADLFIAAISKRHGQRLLTRDRAFSRIRGLTLETY